MKYIIKNINDYKSINLDNFKTQLKHRDDKLRSFLGRLSLKELDNNYNENIIKFNKYGKPYFIDNHIFFNISHSYDYVISVTSNNLIGVDIEKIREVNINTINQFATKNEKKYILSSKENIYKRLFQIYTLKEAYFKMIGTNLNEILNVEFNIRNNKIYCSDNTVKCYFINNLDDYVISYVEKKNESNV